MKKALCLGLAFLLFLMPSRLVLATSGGFSSQYEVHTSAGGAESKFTSSHQGFVRSQNADITSEAGKEGEIDLTPLTFAHQQALKEPTFWEKFLSTITTPLTETLQETIITPVQSGIYKASQALSVASVLSQVSAAFQTVFVNPSNTGIQASRNLISQINSLFQKHSTVIKNTLLALGATSIGFGSLFLRRSFFSTAFKMGMEGILAVSDLILHTGCLIIGGLTALFTGKTVRESYLQSLWSLQKVTGALGSPFQDLKTVKRNLMIGLVGVVSILLIVTVAVPTAKAVIATATVASQSTTPDLAIRTQYSLAKTSQDCSLPMQCDDVFGLGLTLGSNFLVGFSPSTPALQGAGATLFNKSTDDFVKVADNAVAYTDEAIEEISSVSKVLSQTDDVALTFNQNYKLSSRDLETRLKKEFVETYFGSVETPAFKEALEKYPNAMRLIDENHGHIIKEHLVGNDYLIDRLNKEAVVSSFNTAEDLLSTVEKAVTDSNFSNKIHTDLIVNNDFQSKVVIETEADLGKVISRGSKEFSNSNKALLIFRKDSSGNIFVLTGYPIER